MTPMTLSPAGPVPLAAFLSSMHARIDATLRPLIAGAPRVALLDFPAHSNVGDSAIWIGQLAALRSLGIREPAYIATSRNYDAAALRAAVDGGVILISGGGNFGDMWPHHQVFRERVLRDFPDHRIIQLPQSIHFAGRQALDRARRAIAAHPGFTLLVRCERSLATARAQFDAPTELCPDLALRMGPLPRSRSRHDGVVLLQRSDKEGGQSASDTLPAGTERLDWVPESTSVARAAERICINAMIRYPRAVRSLGVGAASLYERLARQRLAHGVEMLSRGRGVITDRLHAHILSLLAGIPHCVLDNSYGKNRAVYEAWTRGVGRVAWCDTRDDAFARIGGLVSADVQGAPA